MPTIQVAFKGRSLRSGQIQHGQTAVSYTHLDVYKRQRMLCITSDVEYFVPLKELNLSTPQPNVNKFLNVTGMLLSKCCINTHLQRVQIKGTKRT